MPAVLQPNIKSSNIDKNAVADIAVKLGITRALSEVLYTRGYNTPDAATDYLAGGLTGLRQAEKLLGISDARDIILNAAQSKLPTVIYGDYDADGVCAVSILKLALMQIGLDAEYYIPDRKIEGYGLNENAVTRLAENYKLLITVDCGISNKREVELAKKLGMTVIITDHHSLPDKLPDCVVVNPHIVSDYGFDGLCGAGVALKLAYALVGTKADELMDIAAIATVADSVPLVDENRYIVKKGLELINGKARRNINVLVCESGYNGTISAHEIAYGLAPRLNAAGRLESARLAVDMLISDKDTKAVAVRLNELNQQRQHMQEKVIQEAMQMAVASGQVRNNKIIILANSGWDKGIVGIAASRITEVFHRPCILFSIVGDEATGSGRSIPALNLFNALKTCEDCFIRYGGHAAAAGMLLKVTRLEELAERLDDYVRNNTEDKDYYPIVKYDARVKLSELDLRLCKELKLLEPFGTDNPEPTFRVDDISFRNIKKVGETKNHINADMSLEEYYVHCVAFNCKANAIDMRYGWRYTVIGKAQLNCFNGTERNGFVIDCTRPIYDCNFIKNQLISNEDKVFSAFFRQVLYNADEVETDYSLLDADDFKQLIYSLLSGNACGTLICSNYTEIADDIISDVMASFPRTDICLWDTCNDINGYNTVLIGNTLENVNLDAYSDILLCDCVSEDYISYISAKAPHAEIYVLQHSKSRLISNCRERFRDFSRKNLAKAYRGMQKVCEIKNIHSSREDLINAVGQCVVDISGTVIDIAIDIFTELGFFNVKTDNGTFGIYAVKNPKQNELKNSSVYIKITNFLEDETDES